MPYRDSPHHEIELHLSFRCLNLLRPNEHKQDYHLRKSNNDFFLFETQDTKYIFFGENLVTFETNDKIVNYSSEHGFNDLKIAFVYREENNYFIFYRKCFPIQE